MAALRDIVALDKTYPPLVFVYRGTAGDGRRFFSTFWPAARAVADEEGSLYEAFSLRRVTLAQALGPAVFRRAWEAYRQGHGVGRPGRDPLRMPGIFVILKPEIIGQRRFAHVGDHPDFIELGRWVASLT